MRRGRQSEDQQFRLMVAESRHRFAPVLAFPERQPLFKRHSFAVFHQPRTLPAPDDFFVQLSKPVHQIPLKENYHETEVPPESSICMSEYGRRKAVRVFKSILVRCCGRFHGRHNQ
jgi:hypothetical protein